MRQEALLGGLFIFTRNSISLMLAERIGLGEIPDYFTFHVFESIDLILRLSLRLETCKPSTISIKI